MNEKLLLNPPEKVLAMYRAVVDLINEGSDIKALKVSDITDAPGSEKGRHTNILRPRKRSSPPPSCIMYRPAWRS